MIKVDNDFNEVTRCACIILIDARHRNTSVDRVPGFVQGIDFRVTGILWIAIRRVFIFEILAACQPGMVTGAAVAGNRLVVAELHRVMGRL